MRLIDRQYTATPFFGVRRMTAMLNRSGHRVNDKRVRRLMRVMGLETIYPKPRTSLKNQAHLVYPYLLSDLVIDRPDQVWATDITFIPLQRGWVYVAAVMDWFSRYRCWPGRMSITLDSSFCVDAAQERMQAWARRRSSNSTTRGASSPARHSRGVLKRHRRREDQHGRCETGV